MKKLIILSASYPYRLKDPFLEYEQKYFPKDIPIDAVPSAYEKRAHSLVGNIPENVSLVPIAWKRMSPARHILYMLKALFNMELWKDLLSLRNENKLNLRSFAKFLSWTSRGDWLFHLLEKHYRRELREYPEQLTFYSFWLLGPAYAGARLRKKYGCHCVSRANGGDMYEERVDYGRLPMRKFTLENCDLILPCSKDGQRYLIDKYRAGDIRALYLGSDDHGIRAAALPEDGQPFVIVSCANLIALKRVELIADALRLIPERKIEWLHFGDGVLREKTEKAVASLPDNVTARLMGRVAHDELMEYYGENDVHLFISLSETEGGVPVSIAEAVSFGIPVLAADAGGTREIVTPENGVLLPLDVSAQAVAEEIRSFMDMTPENYRSMRESARGVWEKSFNAERNYAEFYSLLRSL